MGLEIDDRNRQNRHQVENVSKKVESILKLKPSNIKEKQNHSSEQFNFSRTSNEVIGKEE